MATKLTQHAVDRLKPPPSGDLEIWDSQLPGFGVRVSATGRKSWLVTYRVRGKFKMKVIGNSFTIPKIESARTIAREWMLTAKSGVDPVEQQRAQAKAAEAEADAERQTFRWLAERYVEQYARLRQRPGTLYDTERMLHRVMPFLGDRLARDIKKADITRTLDHFAAAQGMARAIQVCLNTVFKFAAYEDLVDANPMSAIRQDRHGRIGKRERTLSDVEVRAFWSCSARLHWPFGVIARLLLLTGQRRGQVTGMAWAELDLVEKLWSLSSDRTKNGQPHFVPLSSQVTAIIEQVPHRADSDLLFTVAGKAPVQGFSAAKEKLDKMMIAELAQSNLTLPEWRFHDLRRTARTLLSRAGARPDIAERLIGHRVGSAVEAIYDRWQFDSEKRQAAQSLADLVDTIVGGNVIELRTA